MAALRCSVCALNYPNDPSKYAECPECDHPTSVISNAVAMPEADAQYILNKNAFELFYERWDAEKGPLEDRQCAT